MARGLQAWWSLLVLLLTCSAGRQGGVGAAQGEGGGPPPVCVWDLDGTLFCGANAKGAVRTCVSRGFQLAINTNRGREIFTQEDLANFIEHLGFPKEVTQTNLTQWNTDWKRKHVKGVPVRKVYNMERLMEATGQTDKRCLLLFDDEQPNIDAVSEAGYLAQKVYRKGCGTSKEDVIDAMEQFDRHCPAAQRTARLHLPGARSRHRWGAQLEYT